MTRSAPYRYQVGGSLGHHDPSYVERLADTTLYQELIEGEFCYVLNSRQMGKSSLLVRAKTRLEEQGCLCIAIDLTGVGGATATAEQWYKGVIVQLCMGTNLLPQFKLKPWWSGYDDLPLIQRLKLFVEEVLLAHFPERSIIIFIDEIDSVLSLSFPTDEFFAWIRFCFNQRSLNPTYQNLTFALFGVANPSDLIQNPNLTPFNIGTHIELSGFTPAQIQPLLGGLPVPKATAIALLHNILHWTAGQPFLTQKLTQRVSTQLHVGALAMTQDSALETDTAMAPSQAMAQPGLISPSVLPLNPQGVQNLCNDTERFVSDLVQSHVLKDWKTQDQPEHLITIAKRLLSDPDLSQRLLGLYQSVLAGEQIAFDNSQAQVELLLSGLVIPIQGTLQVKNRIYQSIFNQAWVTQELEKLRPYGSAMNTWLDSAEANTAALLRGTTLQQALAWSQDKQLSDLDYRFLAASQALAQQQAQQALVTEKQERELAELTVRALQKATEAYSQAKQTAQHQARHMRLSFGWVAGSSLGVAIGVITLRLTGVFQGVEQSALNQFFQLRPSTGLDPRVTLVTIDEPDIQALGIYPLPDEVFAKAIAQLNRHGPRAIGLDLYRDVPVEPGHGLLMQELKASPHVIAIEKVIEPSIPPPAGLANREQVGFVDQVVDGDGVVRRTLLSMTKRQEEGLLFSLPLQLSMRYLAAENIQPQPLDTGQIQLGKSTISPFLVNQSGFYKRSEDAGFQLLLNYHGPQSAFETIPLADVLTGQFSPELVHDRVLLIGYTADSVNDVFPSPYRDRWLRDAATMAGVTIHANGVSQLLSAALDQRPLLRTWPRWRERCWILLWTSLGVVLTWRIRLRPGQLFGLSLGAVLLYAMAFGAFLQGWWIPWFSPLLGAICAALLVAWLRAKRQETWQLQRLVFLLSRLAQDQGLVGNLALEYLKHIEGRDPAKRRAIHQWLNQEEGDRRR